MPRLFIFTAGIGGLLSHTDKAKSREAYERTLEILRDIDYMWHLNDD